MRQLRRRYWKYLFAGVAALLLWSYAPAIAQTDSPEAAPDSRPALPLAPNVERIVPVLPPELRDVFNSDDEDIPDIARQTVWLD
ncbi:MAG: hypothetical protein AAF289_18685, partial [Cyanobacteria bacterium P01_A01_bin.135]